MAAYYNEIDPFAAAWLRELIKAGQIADGEVDERSIADVRPDDLRGFSQCHFFAGIGGWAYALRLAGWPDDRPVWTGSCPCQPFSTAGAQAGGDDPRHLWPTWFGLLRERRPPVVFGEQVAAAIGHGWLDLVCTDLEGADYAVGAIVAGAHSVGAPHIRQRLWFVADDARGGLGVNGRASWPTGHADERRTSDRLADDHGAGRSQQRRAGLPNDERPAQRHDADRRGADGDVEDADGRALTEGWGAASRQAEGGRAHGRPTGPGAAGERLGDRLGAGLEGLERHGDDGHEPGRLGADAARPTATASGAGDVADADGGIAQHGHLQRGGQHGLRADDRRDGGVAGESEWPKAGFWDACDWLPCSDGKARPVEPGTFPLAYGIPNRVGRLRGYGNAIVPQVAAAFIESYLEIGR